jgi:hypothetical protein
MKYSSKNIQSIVMGLETGAYPQNHSINLYTETITPNDMEALCGALLSGNAPDGLSIIFNELEKKQLDILANYLSIIGSPKRLQLQFKISAVTINTSIHQLADALKSETLPEGLILTIHSNKLDSTDATVLAEALLQPTNALQELSLMLQWTPYSSVKIDHRGVQGITRALRSANALQKLTLNLADHNIGDMGAKELASAISARIVPKKLELYLTQNNIGDEGVIALAEALQTHNFFQELKLILSENRLTKTGIIAIADTLKSGKLPDKTLINLSRNNLGEQSSEGIPLLTEALKSGKAPANLHLIMKNVILSREDVIQLLVALASPDAPRNLTINLEGSLDQHQQNIFIKFIEHGRIPYEVEIQAAPDVTNAFKAYRLACDKMAYEASIQMLLRNKNPDHDGLKLVDDVFSVILSYLHPKGMTIYQNTLSFWDTRQAINRVTDVKTKKFLNTITQPQRFMLSIKTRDVMVRLLSNLEEELLFNSNIPKEKIYANSIYLLRVCKDIDRTIFANKNIFPTLKKMASSLIGHIHRDNSVKDKMEFLIPIVNFCLNNNIDLRDIPCLRPYMAKINHPALPEVDARVTEIKEPDPYEANACRMPSAKK